MQRVHLRGKNDIAKHVLVHAAAFNLSLSLRQLLRVGTTRQGAELIAAFCLCSLRVMPAASWGPLVVGPRWFTVPTARPHCHCRLPRRQALFMSTDC